MIPLATRQNRQYLKSFNSLFVGTDAQDKPYFLSMYFCLNKAANPSSERVYFKSESHNSYGDKVHTNSRGKCSARLKKKISHFGDEATRSLNIPNTRATSPPQINPPRVSSQREPTIAGAQNPKRKAKRSGQTLFS